MQSSLTVLAFVLIIGRAEQIANYLDWCCWRNPAEIGDGWDTSS
jgi:hypothetical protein